MKFCTHCGAELLDEAVICPKCGCPVEGSKQSSEQALNQPINNPQLESYGSKFGWGFLGFCFPLVGLILFLVWKDSKPRSAKAAGIGAIIGFVVNVIVSILYGILLQTLIRTGSFGAIWALLSIL